MYEGEVYSITEYEDMKRFFTAYDVYIGHNVVSFDIPVVERLLNINIREKIIIVDTLGLSWYCFPERNKYGLESFGEDYGIPKPVIEDWNNLSIEEYTHRCEEDVKINQKLWDDILGLLNQLYPEPKNFWRFVKYMTFKLDCIREQEEEKVKLDVDYVEKSLNELEKLKEERYQALQSCMPKVPIKATRKKPSKFFNKKNEVTKKGAEYVQLCIDQGLYPEGYVSDLGSLPETIEIITGYEEPNPSSTPQLKKWLFGLGWKPKTFKYTKDSNGNANEIPQINLPFGAGICGSIKELFDIEPSLEHLDGYFVLQHRIGLLRGFLRDGIGDGYLRARISGLTNTLRFKHSEIVNLPKVNTKYGEYARSSLIAPEGYEYCGADVSGLEDVLKRHFIFPLDPKYVESMDEEGFDPHLDIAVLAGMMTLAEADAYKEGDKSKKKIRDIAKNGNYALI